MSNKNNSTCSLARPQTPTRPFPYHEEAVTYPTTDSITLAGTLTLPKGEGPFPTVMLIAGMGPHDRDASMMGHALFLVIADYLTRHGIAVLRYDKRGVGQSTGNFGPHVTGKELAEDVCAGIKYLQTRLEIDQSKIGLLGHSEGGAIALRIAQQHTDVAFVVALAPAMGMTMENILIQTAQQLTADGASAEIIKADHDLRKQLLTFVIDESRENAQHSMESYATAYLNQLPAAIIDALEQYPFTLKKSSIDKTIMLFNSLAYRYILQHYRKLDRITTPVLALNGTHDFITVSTINLPVVEQALDHTIHAYSRVVEIDHANHWFQACKTGALAEYGSMEETIQPKVLTLVADWIIQQ